MKMIRASIAFACACLTFAPSCLHAQAARLINLSTRGQVGIDANILIGGFSISGGNKTVLVRAIGPALADFGVAGTVADPVLSIINSAGTVVATNDNWQSADGSTFSQVGAFPLTAGSKDAVIVANLPPGGYSAQISGLGTNKTGVALLEVYDVTGTGQLVNIATRLQVGTGANVAIAGFSINPGSGTRKLLIRGVGPALAGFGVPGTLPDPKLTVFDGAAQTIATAVANGSVTALASATAQAGAFATSAGDAATIVTLNPGSYTVQLSGNNNATTGVGLIEVYDITNSVGTPVALASTAPKLYYASLRANSAATTSTASGYATILYDPNTNVATISVNFSNLSSSATSAHLVIGTNASSGNFVFNLPRGQANALTWTFPSTGAYSTAQLIAALQSGQLFVDIDSASFPSGELQGGFALTTGSTTFTAPAAPPALAASALTAPTQTDAARFLTQATYGPTTATIAALQARGINGWIDDQMALPATSLLATVRADLAAVPNPLAPQPNSILFFGHNNNMTAGWWKIAVTAPDQLRQRVAFALSEILVVGEGTENFEYYLESRLKYFDLLVNRSFGNFRDVLEDVTLSPVMGRWLSYLSNPKANPAKGTAPDENYAREVQQLFTIGLVQLQPDGTLMLDSSGQPIPTYNQTTISETAKVFTGWSFKSDSYPDPAKLTDEAHFLTVGPYSSSFTGYPAHFPDDFGWIVPMVSYEAFHDKTVKRVVSLQQVPLDSALPTIIPANQTGPQDLKTMLDALFNHPNTGPFICKQLIQRLVTSNPSPGYVYRVAQKFANDGTGTRGNLGAVVRAIFTDYEARSADVLGNSGYGKVKEPLLRTSAFLRALNAAAPNGQYLDGYFGDPLGFMQFYPRTYLCGTYYFMAQSPLQSRSVFNFFSPTYSPPGAMAAAGLVAPELEITDAYYSLTAPFPMLNLIFRTPASLEPLPPGPSPYLALDYSALLPNAKNSAVLLDQLNLLFCANQMTAATRAAIVTVLQTLPAGTSDLDLVKNALQLVIVSPDSSVQK